MFSSCLQKANMEWYKRGAYLAAKDFRRREQLDARVEV